MSHTAEKNNCPLSAEDAYSLKFEMEQTRKTCETLTKQIGDVSSRMSEFEKKYFEGKGVAIGMKVGAKAGALGVLAFIVAAVLVLWFFVTGKIQFSDIFGLFR